VSIANKVTAVAHEAAIAAERKTNIIFLLADGCRRTTVCAWYIDDCFGIV